MLNIKRKALPKDSDYIASIEINNDDLLLTMNIKHQKAGNVYSYDCTLNNKTPEHTTLIDVLKVADVLIRQGFSDNEKNILKNVYATRLFASYYKDACDVYEQLQIELKEYISDGDDDDINYYTSCLYDGNDINNSYIEYTYGYKKHLGIIRKSIVDGSTLTKISVDSDDTQIQVGTWLFLLEKMCEDNLSMGFIDRLLPQTNICNDARFVLDNHMDAFEHIGCLKDE